MSNNDSWCVKCKRKTPIMNPQIRITKNNRSQMRSTCPTCGITKTQFVSGNTKEGGFGLLKLFGLGKKKKRK